MLNDELSILGVSILVEMIKWHISVFNSIKFLIYDNEAFFVMSNCLEKTCHSLDTSYFPSRIARIG